MYGEVLEPPASGGGVDARCEYEAPTETDRFGGGLVKLVGFWTLEIIDPLLLWLELTLELE